MNRLVLRQPILYELTWILLYPAISSAIPSTQIPAQKSTDASEKTAAASVFSDAVQIPGQKSCSANSQWPHGLDNGIQQKCMEKQIVFVEAVNN